MAIGRHINVLVNSVCREGHSRSRAAGQNIGILDQLDHIGGVSATCTLDVINMNTAAFEDGGCMFEEPGFVEAISVNMALDVMLFTDAILVRLIGNRRSSGTLTSNSCRESTECTQSPREA